VRLNKRAWDGLRVIGFTNTNFWIILELEDTLNANGKVTVATLHNGRKKITSDKIHLEKL